MKSAPKKIFALIFLFLMGMLMASGVNYWTVNKNTSTMYPKNFSDLVNVSDLIVANQKVCLKDGTNCRTEYSGFLNDTEFINESNVFNLNLSFLQMFNDSSLINDINYSTKNVNYSLYCDNWLGDSVLANYLELTDQRYNDTALINTKLNITDQRYNETALIPNVSGFMNVTDQRYNDTAAIDLKLNITDQRYNETQWVIDQNYLTSFTEQDPLAMKLTGADASNITSGTLNFARLPSLTNTHTHDWLNVTNVPDFSNTHTHDAANITSGTLNFARLPALADTHTHAWINITKPSDCSAGQYVSGINDVSLDCSAPTVTLDWQPVYLANDVTTASATAFTNIFTISLTQNKLNTITGELAVSTNKSGDAPQIGFNYSTTIAAGTNGTCFVTTMLTTSTNEFDYLTPVGAAPVDTATAAYVCLNYPCVIPFTCVLNVADVTSLNVWLAGETATQVKVRAGSFYQKFVSA